MFGKSYGWMLLTLMILCSEGKAYENYAIYSWGDYVVTMGCGTDPQMSSPDAAENMLKRWKGRGFTGVIHRMDWPDARPFIHWNELGTGHPAHRHLQWIIDHAYEQYPVSATISQLARKHDMTFLGWWPTVFSDGAPSELEVSGLDGGMSWITEMKYVRENRHTLVVDRTGKKQYSVREYAYPGARYTKVGEVVYMAKKHGIKAFLVGMRSEAAQMQPPPEHADQFGFNKPVVHDMRALYGVDILTDKRFDYKDPDFDLRDPMLENWRRLRGTYLTQFYRELRERLNEVDPNILIAVQVPGGDYAGPPIGNMHLDWRTWIDEGLIDILIPYVTFEGTLDPESHKKGYLTYTNWGANESGMYPLSVFRDYIDNSGHPDTKLIMSGGSYYFFKDPPDGADGWRTDVTYDSFNLGWYQLWQQWKKDLDVFGYIKYFEQDFDAFPKRNSGYFGGWGCAWYDLNKRACDGFWFTLGDGTDGRPTAQDDVVYGLKGLAMQLRQVTSGSMEASEGRGTVGGWYYVPSSDIDQLSARHWSGRDRSMVAFLVDNAMLSGKGELEFRVYLADERSGLASYAYNDFSAPRYEAGVFIAPGGKLCYTQNGKIIESDKSIPVARWEKITVDINIDAMTYSVFAGENGEIQVCSEIPYSLLQNGFNQLLFSPSGEKQSVCYLDNVLFKWKPQLEYMSAKKTVFQDDFENDKPDQSLSGQTGKPWRQTGQGKGFIIENDMSFGNGVHSLRALGGGELSVNIDEPADRVVLDMDIFIRSDQPYIVMPPNQNLKSPHGTTVLIREPNGKTLIGLSAGQNENWQLLSGDESSLTKWTIQYDVWNHVQIVVDRRNRSSQVVIQPVGELPWPAEKRPLRGSADGLSLVIVPTESENHISCYDNIVIAIDD